MSRREENTGTCFFHTWATLKGGPCMKQVPVEENLTIVRLRGWWGGACPAVLMSVCDDSLLHCILCAYLLVSLFLRYCIPV